MARPLITTEDFTEAVINAMKQVLYDGNLEVFETDTIRSLMMDSMQKIEVLMQVEADLRLTINDTCLEDIDDMTVVEFAKHLAEHIQ
jgi:acyl carrier protein